MLLLRPLLLLAFIIATAATARANIGPPPGMKRPKITNRITILEEFPDHVFVIYRHPDFMQNEKPADVVEFVHPAVGKPIELQGQRLETVELFVIQKAVADRYPTVLELAEAASKKRLAVALRAEFRFDEDVPRWYGDEFTINYTLQRSGSGEGLELHRVTWQPHRQCWVACVLFPLATLFGGFWLVRRAWRRYRNSKAEKPAEL